MVKLMKQKSADANVRTELAEYFEEHKDEQQVEPLYACNPLNTTLAL